jgi:hypothetical protein
VPARGWHGEAYRGHIFWDELFVFPILNFRFHEITRSLLLYRYRRLPEARINARQAGYLGTLFPWQSGSSGREESQKIHLNPDSKRWIPDDTHLQYHVNSAIAYNFYQYFQVTGDLEFLAFFGAVIFILSLTWRRGRDLLRKIFKQQRLPVEKFIEDFRKDPPSRVPGTAIYLTGTTEGVPGALLVQLDHYKVIHERVIFLTLITDPVPRVWLKKERIEKEDLGQNFFRVISRQGFMEKKDMSEIFELLNSEGLMEVKMDEASFLIGRANIIPEGFRMNIVASKIFAFMERNALGVSEFIESPPERVIELGAYLDV